MILVNLGDKPPAGFDQPLQMLKDCHRRIEHFLGVIRKVERTFGGGELNDDGRRALNAAIHYFANFAPRHTADEEQSLFPRLADSSASEAARAALERLESDHRIADARHAEVDSLARKWLDSHRLPPAERAKLDQALAELELIYAAHIPLEENELFVLAGQSLDSQQLRDIGDEMRR
ncbi:MAG TPA: hemerythrin domain-containing protein, partial [Lacipirellula sp.]